MLHATNGAVWNSVAAYRAAATASLAELSSVHDRGPLPGQVIQLAAVVRNERTLIASFLTHYRSLGVGRFIIVDHDSTDGTRDVLAAHADVDLWTTSASFAASNQGRLWIDGLLWQRAKNSWILHVDADEFLVFVGMERGGLRGLIRRLQWRRQRRLFAPMLDVYSDKPIRDTMIGTADDPLGICNWFDGDAELTTAQDNGMWVVGGARGRLFFSDEPERWPGLSKYPLVYYDEHTAFIECHTPIPHARNHLRPYARLLHVKLHAGLENDALQAVAAKQHWHDAIEYRRYLEVLRAKPALNAHFQNSRKYDGPESLAASGFMHDPKLRLRDVFAGIWRRS